jgi:DNA mismatch endonuclease, patch repair protein
MKPTRSHSGLREWVLDVDARTSRRLGSVRQSATGAELLVRRGLWQNGIRYTVSNADLPGRPDLANRSRRWAVFVHGCFWHRHQCSRATTPKRNREFWLEKFRTNISRDIRNVSLLKDLGYQVEIIWECELIDNPDEVLFNLTQRIQRSYELEVSSSSSAGSAIKPLC